MFTGFLEGELTTSTLNRWDNWPMSDVSGMRS
jgi:hypothetical protein